MQIRTHHVLHQIEWGIRHTSTMVLGGGLFGLCALLELLAWFNMQVVHRQFLLMNNRTIHNMALIDFLHDHRVLVAAYAALFFATLLWAEVRGYPYWCKTLAFVLLAVPCLMYAEACLYIFGKIMIL